MNKLGQSSVIFIILIPVFLVITALIVDTGINMYNEKKLKNVTEDVIINLLESGILDDYDYSNKEEVTTELKEKATYIYKNNEIDTEYLYIEILYGSRIKISNSNEYYSFMNSLFNKGNGNRQTTVEAEGHIENDKVVVTFEGDNYEN